jgi:hypothetical protein
MDRARKFLSLFAALAMTSLLAVACDSGTQEPAAPDDEMPITSGDARDADSEATPTEPAEGSIADIPDEFPSEVPIYPGSVAAQSKGAVSDSGPMAALQLQTSDAPEKVYDFYLEKFSGEGWTIEDHEGFEGKNAISATNGRCTATIMAAPAEDGGGSNVFVITECS